MRWWWWWEEREEMPKDGASHPASLIYESVIILTITISHSPIVNEYKPLK